MPSDLELDIVGAAIGNPEITLTVPVTDRHFADGRLGAIWSTISDLHRQGIAPDPITICNNNTGVRIEPAQVIDCVGRGIPANASVYADLLIQRWQRRSLSGALTSASQALVDDQPIDQVIATLDQAIDATTTADAAVADVRADTLDEFCDQPLPPEEWIIPRLLAKGDRLILTGGEGSGKSVLMRQIAASAAAGIDPFGFERIPAQRVLVVDAENPVRIMAARFGEIRDHLARRGLSCQDRLRIARRPQGLDLSRPADRLWMHQLVRTWQPDALVIGPAYKLYVGGSQTREEDLARQVTSAIDELREAFGLAVILEHHSGHAAPGQKRQPRPIGSSLWLRWPEFGIGLVDDKEHLQPGDLRRGMRRVELAHWRGARDNRPWPAHLESGGTMPWIIPDDEIADYAA